MDYKFPLLPVLAKAVREAEGRSSGGERLLDTQEVGGSKPPVPTIQFAKIKGLGGTRSEASVFWGVLGNIWETPGRRGGL